MEFINGKKYMSYSLWANKPYIKDKEREYKAWGLIHQDAEITFITAIFSGKDTVHCFTYELNGYTHIKRINRTEDLQKLILMSDRMENLIKKMNQIGDDNAK